MHDLAPGKERRHAAAYPEKSTSTYYSIVILGLNELLLLTAICRSLRVYSVLEILELDSCRKTRQYSLIMSKNVIWEFFKKSGSDPSEAQCNECCKLLSLGSDKP